MSRILAVAIALSLLLTFMPASPVLAAPQLSLSPISGARGTKVIVTGTNFASYIGDVIHVLFGGVEIADSPLAVPENGTFEATFDVPRNVAPGIAYVTVSDTNGSLLVRSNPFTIVGPNIRIDPKVGTVSTKVTVYGKGLYASSKATFYYYSNAARVKIGVDVTSPIGEVTYSFAIPDSTSGSHRVVVRDADDNETEAYFDVISAITLKPASAPIGAEVTVSGTGFGYKSNVTIHLGDTKVATEITDEQGNFEATFNVLAIKPGTYDLEVWDKDDNSGEAKFIIIATTAALTPIIGHVGTEVTVSGAGYITGRMVTIKYDATEVATATVETNGTFSATFNVPSSKYGDHIITTSDGTTTKQFTFTMESEAPPIPLLLLPEIGIKVKSPVHFGWEDVTDDSSPVTYSFQIATSEDFTATSIVLVLTESGYTTTEEERLELVSKKEPYYWRVKAIDSASNESEWSGAGSFYVGFTFSMPTWAIYSLIGFGVLLLGVTIFWWRRRAAY